MVGWFENTFEMIDPKNIIKNLPENEAQEYADLQLADQLKNMQNLGIAIWIILR